MPLSGHLWTILPRLSRAIRPPAVPPCVPWSTVVDDPAIGPVRLSGQLHEPPGATGLVLVVHGLGGSADSHYMALAVRSCWEVGLGTLRFNLRGSDLSGEDFYHAGLIADLDAALASPALAEYADLYVLGYSLGGHVVLRWAVESGHPRVRAVAAVCSPVDLAASSDAFSQRMWGAYRYYVMSGLVRIYERVAERRPVPISVAAAACIRGLREWDERIVAPRHGFAGADDYYQRMSVAPHLGRLSYPALFVGSEADPMVPVDTVRPRLVPVPSRLEVRWTARGGHVSFPRDLDLGLSSRRGLEPQVIDWLRRQQ